MARRRSHFARHLESVWQQLAQQVHGQFIQGGTWKTDKIRAHVSDWTVTLEVRSVPGFKSEELFTRLRAPIVNPGAFRFCIHPRNILSRGAALLGLSPVETGYRELEQHYAVHSNDPQKTREVLAGEAVRRFLIDRGDVTIQVRDDGGYHGDEFPNGVDELCCEVPDAVDELDELERLYGVFARVLQTLCDMLSDYEPRPGSQG
jgi:hypothetical protein